MDALEETWASLPGMLSGWRKSGKEYKARCPAHNDKNPSLSIGRGDDGKIIFHCYAGCDQRDIVDALGLQFQDLYPQKQKPKGPPEVVARYEYHDASGALLYRVCRFSPGARQRFMPEHKTNTGWQWGMGPKGPTLYRLPGLLQAVKDKRPIIIVEGEKDADNVYSLGLDATCCPSGANNWREHYQNHFQGADVYVCGDNDAAGRSYVASVVTNLQGVAKSIRVVRLPLKKRGADVSDWIAKGGTIEGFQRLMRAAKKITARDMPSPEAFETIAQQQRAVGKDTPQIEAALDAFNATVAIPLSSDEISTIAANAAKEKRGLPPLERNSELTFARYVLAQMGPGIVYAESAFYKYAHKSPGIWSEIEESHISRAINNLEGRFYESGGTKDCKQYKQISINASVSSGALKLAKDEAAKPDFFNDAAHVVVLKNATLRAAGDEITIEEHSKAHAARACLPFDYEPDAPAPRWAAFLEDILPTSGGMKSCQLILQEFVGACLFGLGTRYQTCFILFGGGMNGKSKFQEVIAALFPPDTIASVSPQSFDQDYHAAALAGKLINIVSEVPSVECSNSARVKAIISGDVCTVRMPYRQPFNMAARAGNLFACNELSATKDTTHGYWRRFCPIPFLETISPEKRDPLIADRIIKEELSGVFSWAIKGAARLLKAGAYTRADASDSLKKEWISESDSVSTFAADVILTDAKGDWITCKGCEDKPGRLNGCAACRGVQSSVLFDRYVTWCKHYHHRPVSISKFARRLKSIGIEKQSRSKGRFYLVDAITKWEPTNYYKELH